MKKEKELTPKQKRFCEEYIIDLNATDAYRRTGYKSKNPDVDCQKLLGNARVRDYIEFLKQERQERTQITQDWVIKELAKVAGVDIKDYLSFKTEKTVIGHNMDDGSPIIGYAHVVDVKNSDDVEGAAVAAVKLKDGQLEFRLHDKMKALELLGRHLGMYKDKTEITGKDGGPIDEKVEIVFNMPQPPGKREKDPEPEGENDG